MWYNFEVTQFAKAQKEGGINFGKILGHKNEDEDQEKSENGKK